MYEIVLDGELAADLSDASLPFERVAAAERRSSVSPASDPAALAVTWRLLESLGYRRDGHPAGGRHRLGRVRRPGVPSAGALASSSTRVMARDTAARNVEVSGQPSRRQDMSVNADVGPIDYLALEFPGARLTGEGMAILIDLVDRGIIRILDMRAMVRGEDGAVTAVAISDLDGDGTLDLAIFEGVGSDLLDEEDLKGGRAGAPATPSRSSSTRTPGQAPSYPPCSARAPRSWRAAASPPTRSRTARSASRRSRRRGRRPASGPTEPSANDPHTRPKEHIMGLMGGMARTAVVAGTATAVSNRVSRRQAGRWAAQEEQAARPHRRLPAPAAGVCAPPPAPQPDAPTRTPTSRASSSSVSCAPRAC